MYILVSLYTHILSLSFTYPLYTIHYTPYIYILPGLSEEQAHSEYGRDSVVVYHSRFIPLSHQLATDPAVKHLAYTKVVCTAGPERRVLGLHFLGPHAGEVSPDNPNHPNIYIYI